MRIQSKNPACGAFCSISLACGTFCFYKKSGLRRILFVRNLLLNHLRMHFIYSVYQYISGENYLNSNIELSQQHDLYQTVITKLSNNKPYVKSNLLIYKSHNLFQFKNSLLETTYVITCNITITNTRLISILLRLYAVSSRLLLNLWQRLAGSE